MDDGQAATTQAAQSSNQAPKNQNRGNRRNDGRHRNQNNGGNGRPNDGADHNSNSNRGRGGNNYRRNGGRFVGQKHKAAKDFDSVIKVRAFKIHK